MANKYLSSLESASVRNSLKVLASKNKLSLSAIGRIIGCSKGTVWALFNDDSKPVKRIYAVRLAKHLGVSDSEFSKGTDDPIKNLKSTWNISTCSREFRDVAWKLASCVSEFCLLTNDDVSVTASVHCTHDPLFYISWRIQEGVNSCQVIAHLNTSTKTRSWYAELVRADNKVINRSVLSLDYMARVLTWLSNNQQ